MDISTVTDINALKVMAYDAIAAKEQAEGNLMVINARIAQLQTEQKDAAPLPSADDEDTSTTTTTTVSE